MSGSVLSVTTPSVTSIPSTSPSPSSRSIARRVGPLDDSLERASCTSGLASTRVEAALDGGPGAGGEHRFETLQLVGQRPRCSTASTSTAVKTCVVR